jgi:S1-C subfamily serine protease
MSEFLKNFSDALASTVETLGASIVRVEGRRRIPATGIVWSADGVVVTAQHVVRQDDNIQVGLPDGQTAEATLVGRDETTDLGVLRLEAKNLSVPTWAEPSDLKVGHLMLALGRPGRTVQATMGIVSALGDSWRTPVGGTIDRYLQTDVVMYPGFSGGPLVSVDGRVAGLNTSALLRGVSLAVPVPTLRRVAETLLKHGRVKRGYLGVSTQTVRLPAGLQDQLKQETGLLLVAVEADSPAEKGGLLLGDTIVNFAGSSIRNHDDLLALLSGEQVGTAIKVQLVRGGKVQAVNVTVGERG